MGRKLGIVPYIAGVFSIPFFSSVASSHFLLKLLELTIYWEYNLWAVLTKRDSVIDYIEDQNLAGFKLLLCVSYT